MGACSRGFATTKVAAADDDGVLGVELARLNETNRIKGTRATRPERNCRAFRIPQEWWGRGSGIRRQIWSVSDIIPHDENRPAKHSLHRPNLSVLGVVFNP